MFDWNLGRELEFCFCSIKIPMWFDSDLYSTIPEQREKETSSSLTVEILEVKEVSESLDDWFS